MSSKIKELLARKEAEKASALTTATLLDTPTSDLLDGELELITVVNLPAGQTDPRLKLLSHSSRGLLHKCPRKYQLYRLNSQVQEMEASLEANQAVTFAYGKVVGMGMQSTLEEKSEEQVYLDCFLEWDTDLLADNPKQNKSFWLAMQATKKFMSLRAGGFLEDYELVIYNGKPAVELSFQVILPDGYKYRGFVDAVLRHRATGEILVLEAKTSSGNANSTMYKNSGQALGYSVVLDILFPELSSYTVLYLVYESRNYEFVEFPFKKSLLQRALWLQELIIDTQVISLYESYETYPQHGEACYDFFRDCEYLSLCTLTTANLVKPLTQQMLDKIAVADSEYQFSVTFDELVEMQIKKGDM